jgi:hypothetical protein
MEHAMTIKSTMPIPNLLVTFASCGPGALLKRARRIQAPVKFPAAVIATLLVGMFPACLRAQAEVPVAAVFAFQLDDTSLQGSTGENSDDLARLTRLDTQLRDTLSQSGQYAPVAVPPGPGQRPLWICNGCETDQARKVGAKVSVIGWVQKVSNLILNINVIIRDAGSGQRIAAGSVDIRGDTDESWTRGLSYLLRYRILNKELAP